MRWFIGLLLILLLLVGCGQKTVYVCSDQTQVEDAIDCADTTQQEITPSEIFDYSIDTVAPEEETTTETPEQQSYVLSDTEKSVLAERFTASTRATLSTPLVKNLHVGDVSVIGLGLRNILGSVSHDFVVDITFREAKDFSGSILQTDDELIQAWLDKNIFTIYTLDRGEEITLPIIIEVGDYLTKTKDPVVPGTYIYDVYISYVTNPESTDEYQNLILTVQVTG